MELFRLDNNKYLYKIFEHNNNNILYILYYDLPSDRYIHISNRFYLLFKTDCF